MIDIVPPAAIFIVGALIVPFLRGKLKSSLMLLLPVLVFAVLLKMPEGKYWTLQVLDYHLIFGRVDKLSMAFGYIFTIITFIGILFALKVDDDLQHVSALGYAGGALGVTFAGDFFTLYIFWEVLAISSTFLILARRTKSSQGAAYRYILVHVVGGLCLLAGIVITVQETGTLEFGTIGLNGAGSWFIFIGIALNAAIFPLHPWLQDAYPEATVTGAVFMSVLTTKSAVYVMVRTFPGSEFLVWAGLIMAVVPVFYALLENDIRRVLAFSIISQGGFMIVGIGIGTDLSINGTVAHAFCSILYTALLFMSAGSILHMTGKIKCTDLGGLYKTMPLTTLFFAIGALSISGMPLLNGFISKSMVISAAGHEKMAIPWLILLFVSGATFIYAGLKVPVASFFRGESPPEAKEPPLNMLLAMGITAFLCLVIGIFPGFLYHLLPYPVHYVPYTGAHIVTQLQLMMFGGLAFYFLFIFGYYPEEVEGINLDTDWFYRKGGRLFYIFVDKVLNGINSLSNRFIVRDLSEKLGQWSRVPVSSLVTIYLKVAGRDTVEKDQTSDGPKPETENLMPMGVPVFLSFIGLFFVFVLFVTLI
jgi:multicomponent Na+:H+ antiporter subunit D